MVCRTESPCCAVKTDKKNQHYYICLNKIKQFFLSAPGLIHPMPSYRSCIVFRKSKFIQAYEIYRRCPCCRVLMGLEPPCWISYKICMFRATNTCMHTEENANLLSMFGTEPSGIRKYMGLWTGLVKYLFHNQAVTGSKSRPLV